MLVAQRQHESPFSSRATVARVVEAARSAQTDWAATSVSRRLQKVKAFRALLAERALDLAASVEQPERRFAAETLSAEIHPLAKACRFLERRASSILAPRRSGGVRGRWPGGITMVVERRPLGVVLVVCAGNYPIFLPGVQTLQALVAGNGVLLKPAPGTEAAVQAIVDLLIEAGFDERLLVVLDSSRETVGKVLATGIDKLLFTGSSSTGRTLLSQATPSLTPATLELSGCDAVFIHPRADLDLVVEALVFGLTFNSSATCIAPRRVYVPHSLAEELEARIVDATAAHAPVWPTPKRSRDLDLLIEDALRHGAHLVVGETDGGSWVPPVVLGGVDPVMAAARADIFAPLLSILPVEHLDEALMADRQCPYALGASVFGPSRAAREWAEHIDVGVVTINDLIAPTAEPEVSFGGRGESGFGVTRGPEGLLDLTRPRTIVRRSGRWRPHFQPLAAGDEVLFAAWIRARHEGSWIGRLHGWIGLGRALARRSRRSGTT